MPAWGSEFPGVLRVQCFYGRLGFTRLGLGVKGLGLGFGGRIVSHQVTSCNFRRSDLGNDSTSFTKAPSADRKAPSVEPKAATAQKVLLYLLEAVSGDLLSNPIS